MTALDRLSQLLRDSLKVAERPLRTTDALESVVALLQEHNKAVSGNSVPQDLQQAAVKRFWKSQRLETLKDARLVSFGLCVPSRPSSPCVMEDRQRFLAVLDTKTGVDQWADRPRWFRRCYQGLVRSYFAYELDPVSPVGEKNRSDLRDYLNKRIRNIVDEKQNPDWVTTVVTHQRLFSEDPYTPYAAAVLSGNSTEIDHLCAQLGIVQSSWFLRELVLAQVRHATEQSDESFKALIPRLLKLLADNQVLRDRGLILILNKYAQASQPGINEPLRHTAVEWWGNPWLPSNEMRWGGVEPAARDMVSEWLKREFVEAFFTKLAVDGVGDRRRANFWLRYVKSMDNIRFALGAQALSSEDRDFEVLRKKMEGLYTELKDSSRANNAFIMTLGNLVAVEFGEMGHAFYGYDVRKALPFDSSHSLGMRVNFPNSLKHDSCMLKMRHQDGIHGRKWEDMFEGTLREHFDICPNVPKGHLSTRSPRAARPLDAAAQTPTPPTSTGVKFSKRALADYARENGLKVDDKTEINGNLWVRTDDGNPQVNKVLLGWGFRYKPGKGWWR